MQASLKTPQRREFIQGILALVLGVSNVLAASSLATGAPNSRGVSLEVRVQPRWSGHPLEFDALTNSTPAGQRLCVTRLDFLLSEFALRQTNGAWIEYTNWFAYIGGRDARTAF